LSRVYIKNRFEKNPPNTIRVARPSRWGNPYSLKDFSREKSLQLYEEWLIEQLDNDPTFLEPLRNKNLACFCKPNEKCHVDILLGYISKIYCDFLKDFEFGGVKNYY